MSLLLTRDTKLIATDEITQDPHFQDLRILRAQTDKSVAENFSNKKYQIQHNFADYTPLKAVLCRKGTFSNGRERVVIHLHLSLKDFIDIVRYDPSDPPKDDYNALEMQRSHEQTQSDFKGQKSANKQDFKNYILEGINGKRTIYLPIIAGWQSKKVFDRTVFLALDEEEPDALYGMIYLPRSPIMQADGQTQTAALFAVAASKDAIDVGALEKLTVSLEIELNVNERKAGQSFADRNGRGSKKNKNLVIGFDTSSAISDLRERAIEGTIFENRLANGRNPGPTETATGNIVDLSTMEQMLLNVISGGTRKAEHFKHHHVEAFLPFAQEFLKMLEELFGPYWLEDTPAKQDAFRKLYVHGWPFCLKALALAYYKTRSGKIAPFLGAMNARDAGKTVEEAFQSAAKSAQGSAPVPAVSFDELKDRLSKIDWLRYRQHWIAITGANMKAGKKKTFKLKSTGEEKVVAQAQNTATVIAAVWEKILSDSWHDLTAQVDEPLN